ncbi:siphovirus Gp157 family protein [bacterium]|nr:siphovirus Gp157 family protein [bacterium]MBR2387090.1 siphovirus Gp157 family protein [bacterium]
MIKVIFDEEKHLYTAVDAATGEILNDLVSVTTLLKKHNLSPDYSMVDEAVLNAKAERGKVIHEELEKFINNNENGFTNELQLFIDKCKEMDITPKLSEFIVHNDEIAGTVDVEGFMTVPGNNPSEMPEKTFIGDFKTTATLHKETVAWQLSLYAYLSGNKYDKFLVFHFPDENTLKVVELKPIAVTEIEKLLQCEKDCEIYEAPSLELTVADSEKIVAIQNELKALDDRKKELEKQEAELKEFLIEKMEETGVKQIDNELFKITYIAPSQRETLDSARIKKELPEVAATYTKTSLVKASVRITLKD